MKKILFFLMLTLLCIPWATRAQSINVSPSSIETGAGGYSNTLTVTYDGYNVSDYYPSVQFYDADGITPIESGAYSWLSAYFYQGELNCGFGDNPGLARTAYFRVVLLDRNNNYNEVAYSNLVTVSQAANDCPAPDHLALTEGSLTTKGGSFTWTGYTNEYWMYIELLDGIYYELLSDNDENGRIITANFDDGIPQNFYFNNEQYPIGHFTNNGFDWSDNGGVTTYSNPNPGCIKTYSHDIGTRKLELYMSQRTYPTIISFEAMLSAGGNNKGSFWIDGIKVLEISGGEFQTKDWTQYSFELSEYNEHTLKWEYTKNDDTWYGDDALFLDDIIIYKYSVVNYNYNPVHFYSNSGTLNDLGEGTYRVFVKGVCPDYNETGESNAVVFTTAPNCQVPDHLTATNVTGTSADIRWAGYGYDHFDIFRANEDLSSVDSNRVNDASSTFSGLSPNTTYKVWLKTTCETSMRGPSTRGITTITSDTLVFTTNCGAALPYFEDFENCAATSMENDHYSRLPECWNSYNETNYEWYQGYPTVLNTTVNFFGYPYSGERHLCLKSHYANGESYDYSNLYAIMPAMGTVAVNTLQLSFYACRGNDNHNNVPLYVGVMSDPTDINTFDPFETIEITGVNTSVWGDEYEGYQYHGYNQYTVDFSNYTGEGKYIAFMMEPATSSYEPKTIYIDDINCVSTAVPSSSCNITFDLVDSYGDGWNDNTIEVRDAATGELLATMANEDLDGDSQGANEHNVIPLSVNNGQEIVLLWVFDAETRCCAQECSWVITGPNGDIITQGSGSDNMQSGLELATYTVSCSTTPSPISYCQPAPTTVDGEGIINVSFGTGNNIVNNSSHPTSEPYYGDYSTQIGAVAAGTIATVDITYNTCVSSCYNYGTIIWVDWNNNGAFEDNEIVFTGQSSTSNPTGVHTLNATFAISASQATGDYRMRIGGADMYFDDYLSYGQGDHDPCNSEDYTVFHDYTLRVTEASTCNPVTNLRVLDIESDDARITWTSNGNEEYWDLYWTTSDVAPTDETTPTVGNTSNPSPWLIPLTPNTHYYAYVRARCSDSNRSHWSSAVEFTTESAPVTCPAVTNLRVLDIESDDARITWTSNGNEEYWDLYWTTSNVAPTDETTPTVGNTSNPSPWLIPLIPNTHYYAYVRARCSDSNRSHWSSAVEFTTESAPVTCPTVTNPTASNITANTVQLSWNRGEGGEENEWRIERYLYSANTPESSTLVYDSSVTIFGLQPETTYSFQIQAICDETSSSIFSDWVTVTTLPAPDNCYTVANSTTNATSNSFSPIYGTRCHQRQRTQSIYPASMLTELIGKTITQMKYYVSASQNYNWRNKVFTVKLATVNEESIDTSFVYLDNYTIVYTGTLYATMSDGMVITFNGTAPFTYQGGNLLVEFESTTHNDGESQDCWFEGIPNPHGSIYEYIYQDRYDNILDIRGDINDFLPKVDFCTEPSPCPAVTNLAVSDITSNSAHVSWMPGSSETLWQYICSETELSNQALQDYNWLTAYDLFVNLSNLNVNTTYHVYVRPEIRGNSYCSDEIRHISFTTIPTCLPPTNVTISNITSSTATVSWEYVNGFVPESGWIMHLSTTPQFGNNDIYRAISGGNDMESPFTIRELQAGTTYYLKMQSNCRTQQHFNDFSTWTEEYSFTTPCDAIVVDAEHSFTENFDTTAFPPTNCWSRINANAHAWSRVGASEYNHSGAVNGSAYSSFWGDIYLIMPDIALANDANDVNLTFWSYNTEPLSYTRSNNSVVLLDGNNETVLWSPSFVRREWAETTINLNQYKGQTVRLAFKHTGDQVNGWYVDDITIAETTHMECPNVTNLNAELLGDGSDSVKISWASLDTSFVMQYEIFLSYIYGPDQDSINSLSNFTNPLHGTNRGTIRNYVVYGDLEPNTQYYAYVRRWCTFDNGASVSFGDWSTVSFTTLEAPHTITYMDGNEVLATVSYTYGEAVNPMNAPSKEGYTFIGWYPEEPATMPNHDEILYAQWQANKYNITINQVTGGTITVEVVDNLGNAFSATTDTAATYNAWVSLFVETDAGYTLGNYIVNTASGIPIEIINSGFVMPAENVTISANFESEKHILTINYIYSTSGNNIYPSYKDTLEYGESYSVVSPPENDGFYPSIDTVSGVMGAEDITISVSYLPRVYQVTLHPRGGMLLNGFTSDTTYTRGQVFWLPTADDIVREGYSFGGWFTDTNFNGNPWIAIPNVATGDWDLYAKWDINDHIITYLDGNDILDVDTFTYGANITPIADPTKEGYTFTGWTPALPAIMPDYDFRVIAQWQVNKYNITINQVTGGTITISVVDNFGNAFRTTTDTSAYYNAQVYLNAMADEGYTFSNFVVTTIDGIPVETPNNGFNMPAEDVTVSANFELEKHILTINYFYFENGTVQAAPSYTDTLEYGESYSVVSPIVQGFNPTIGTVSGVMGTDDITVRVDYIPEVYQVTLHTMGGTLLNGFTSDTIHRYTEVLYLPTANDIAREGYSFGGWFTNTNFNGNPWTVIPNVATGDWDLYAKWVINSYEVTTTVTPDANAGTVTGAGTYNYGSEVEMRAEAAEGYLFSNWTNAQGVVVSTDAIFDFEITNDTAFTANFTAMGVVATPTFSPAGGTYYDYDNVHVTLECSSSGATIYYTTDGSTPTANSTTYSSPITITENTTIKAIAMKEGMTNSEMATATYVITPTYTVTIANDIVNGTVRADVSRAAEGETVNLTAIANNGYHLSTWAITTETGTVEVSANNSFAMPADNVTISATFEPNGHTITYYNVSGEIITVDTFAYGDTITPIADPSVVGYTFTGWYPALPTTMPDYDLTPMAHWQINRYRININQVQGGIVQAIEVVDYSTGETIVIDSADYGSWVQISAITNDGCTYNDVVVTDANGTVLSVSNNGFTMPASDVTVTPRFTIQEFTITYGDRGNIFKVDTFAYGANITPIADPTWEGHTFIGWDPALPITMPANNLFVDALWQVNSYKVTVTQVTGGTISIYYYDETGHENNITTGDSIYYGAWIYFRRVVTDNGYSFNSYVVTDADGSPIATPNNNYFIMPANDVTVTANFDVRSYELTINYLYQNGAEAAPSYTDTIEYNTAYSVVSPALTGYTASQDTVMGTMGAENMIVRVIYSINSYNITVNQVTGGTVSVSVEDAPASTTSNTTANYNTRVQLSQMPDNGYSFNGFTVTTADGTPIAVQNNAFTMPANDVTVSANFTANEYTITYYMMNGSNTIWEVDTFAYGDTITTVANPIRDGYTFTGWSGAIPTTMPAHSIAVSAQWQVNSYNITINQVTGGTITVMVNNVGSTMTTTNTSANFGSSIQLIVETANGYTFNNFVVTNADGTLIETSNDGFFMPANDVTVSANITANEYTITYMNGNDVLAVDTVACGDTITPIADPTMLGHTFIGWGSTLPTIMPARNVIASPQWQVNKYRININQVQGGYVQATNVIDSAKYASWVQLSAVANDGYTFYGIVVTDTGGTVLSTTNNGFAMPASDVTVTATFTINSYDLTIHYLYLDGTQAAPTYTETIEYNTAYSVVSPVVTGYTASQDTVMGIMGAADVIERVIYRVNSYNITYISDQDTFEVVTYDYGETIDAMSAPEKEGYTFTGWNPAEPVTMPDSNMTLYAQWELIPCMAAENLAVANGSLTATSALITWNSSQDNSFGGVLYENGVLTESESQLSQSWHLSELQPSTHYRVGVFAYCSFDRISDTVWLNFNTNDTCYPPVSVSISDVTAHTALLSYDFGEHVPDNFLVLISTDPDFADPDGISTSTEYHPNSLTIGRPDIDMQSGTTYYVKMTSQCNPGVISVWSETLSFTTLQEYAITIDANITNGTVSADTAIATAGTVVNLTATPDNGYSFGEWVVTSVNTPAPDTITVTNNSFVMPEGEVNVSATFTPNSYNITINQVTGGTIVITIDNSPGIALSTTADYNSWINLDVVTFDGYTFNNFVVTNADGSPIAIPNNGFFMPANDVTVTGTFTINSYDLTIHYLYQDGTQAAPTFTETIEYNTAYSVASPAETGYTASQDTVMGIMGAEDVIERVIYSVNSYNITYISDLDTFEVVTYNYGDTIDAMSEPEKEDYIFTGWNPAEPVTMPDSNMTLYAQWELIPCMAAENLAVANGSLTATSALITWNSSQDNSFGGVLYENGVLTESESQLFQRWNLSELQPSTNYRVGVFAYCSFDRISDTVWVEFTTNDTCYPPVSISIDNIKAHEATLHYSFGEHVPDNYIVLISTDPDFVDPISLSTSTSAEYYPDSIVLNSIVGVELQAGTTYYLKMSSFCSIEPELISVWTETINFTTLQEYAITIDDNITNGTVSADVTVATAGTIVNLTATPDNGYSFGEWVVTTVNTPAPEIVTVTDNSFVMPEGGVNVSATFTPNSYKVTINQATGGVVMIILEGAAVGTTIGDSVQYNSWVRLDALTFDGYTFGDFVVTTASGNTIEVTNNGSYNGFMMPAEDVTVTATFSVNNYTITYMDGNSILAQDTFAFGAAITPIDNPTREGYTFMGWNPALPTTMPAEDLFVNAQWQINSYNIAIEQVAGGTITVSFAGESATSLISTTTDTSANFETWIQLSADADLGYNFVDFLVTTVSGDTLETPNNGFIMPAENVTVTAIFSINNYTITYMDGNNMLAQDTFAFGATITPIANPTREGYTFMGWNPALPTTMPAEDLFVNAQWQINSYNIAIEQVTGGTITVSFAGESATSYVSTTTDTSANFETWIQLSADADYAYDFVDFVVTTASGDTLETPNNGFIMPAENVTVTAIFTLHYFNVTVNVSDETPWGTVTGSGSFVYGSTDTLTATANDQYIFVGWSDFNTENPRVITVTSDTVLTAFFVPEEIEIISDDTLTGSVSIHIPGGHLSPNSPIVITAVPEPHYHFVSWSDGNTDNPRTILPIQAVGLTAIFAIDQHTVTVLSNDDNMGTVDGNVTADYGTVIQISATAYDGYAFVSWNDGNTENPRYITVESDTTFVATFQLVDGIEDVNMSNVDVYSYNNQVVIANAEGFSVEIFDMSGRLVVSENSISQSVCRYTISTDGIYLVKVGKNLYKKVKIAR